MKESDCMSVCLKQNRFGTDGPCAICGDTEEPDERAFFLDGTWQWYVANAQPSLPRVYMRCWYPGPRTTHKTPPRRQPCTSRPPERVHLILCGSAGRQDTSYAPCEQELGRRTNVAESHMAALRESPAGKAYGSGPGPHLTTGR